MEIHGNEGMRNRIETAPRKGIGCLRIHVYKRLSGARSILEGLYQHDGTRSAANQLLLLNETPHLTYISCLSVSIWYYVVAIAGSRE